MSVDSVCGHIIYKNLLLSNLLATLGFIEYKATIMIMRWENCTVSFHVCVNEHSY